jgi:hypothetical protein
MILRSSFPSAKLAQQHTQVDEHKVWIPCVKELSDE